MSEKHKILVIEDSEIEHELLRSFLDSQFDLTFATTVAMGLEKLKSSQYKLLLLDAILPDGNGFELCMKIRNELKLELPVIFITGKTALSDLLAAFSVGADDFVTKPYNQLELTARIKARMPRAEDLAQPLIQGCLEVNQLAQRVFLVNGSDRSELNVKGHEYHLLVHFMKHPDHVLTRSQLLDAVWGNQVSVTDRTVDTHISKLKKKLGDMRACIESVHGQGYRFSPPVKSRQKAA